MTALRLARVEALDFGRHQHIDFDDLDHDFVVVFGPNESGKSTLAEFLSWAIGGPWRAFKDGSTRYRPRPGVDVVGGRLIGRLGADRFDLDARFKLLGRGNPTDNRLLEIKGRTYGADAIANLLGGLSPVDYELIYRLYGVELGHPASEKPDSENRFSDLFTRFALDSTQANLNPRDRLSRLKVEREALAKRLKDTDRKLKSIRSQITAAAANPERVREIDARLDAIDRRTVDIDLELAERRSTLTDIETARAAREARDKRQILLEEREAVGRVPDEWIAVVAVADQITSVRGRLESLDSAIVEARREAEIALDRAGVTDEVCRRHGLAASDRTSLQSTHHQVMEAVTARLVAEDRLDSVRAASRPVADEAAAAARRLGVPTGEVGRFVGTGDTIRTLRTLVASWNVAEADLAERRAELAAAEAALAGLEAGPDPHEPPPSPPPTWPFLVAAVAAAGLGFVHPVVAVVGVVVVAAVWFAVDRRGGGRRASVSTGNATVEPRREANAAVARAAGSVAAATSRRDDLTARLRTAIEPLGLAVPDPAGSNDWLDGLERLVVAADTARRLETDHDEARRALAAAEADLAARRQILADRLMPWGVATVPADESFVEWLDDFGTAHQRVADHDRLVADRHRLAVEFDELMAPAAELVAGRPWPLIDQELTRHRERVERITDLTAQLAMADEAARAARADQPRIATLLDRYRSDEALAGATQGLATTIAELESEQTTLVEERAGLRHERDQLEAVEVLPGLHLENGEVLAERVDLDAEYRATAMAVQILADVIDEHERTNQDPLIQRAQVLIEEVVADWGTLLYSRDDKGRVVIERDGDGGRLDDSRLSDGGRALLYFGLRIACAERDHERRGFALPLLCDDPLIHFDDRRTCAGLELLKDVAARHQVVLFTCEESTRDLAGDLGAHIVRL